LEIFLLAHNFIGFTFPFAAELGSAISSGVLTEYALFSAMRPFAIQYGIDWYQAKQEKRWTTRRNEKVKNSFFDWPQSDEATLGEITIEHKGLRDEYTESMIHGLDYRKSAIEVLFENPSFPMGP
jgi:hypothetical protein